MWTSILGAVIVNADLGETKSLEKALEGADIMFLTTHYWDERNKEKEVIKVCTVFQGKELLE